MAMLIKPAPVVKRIVVEASQQRAFDVFVAGMGGWWLKTHSIGGSPQKDVVIEQRPGGLWYEVGEDGTHSQWGKVLAIDPPRRIVLAWQVSAQWSFDPSLMTEVEVRFTPDGAGRTLVELEHRLLENYGEAAAGQASVFDSEGGWTGLLAKFAEMA